MYKDPNKQREFQRIRVSKKRSSYLFGKICKKCGSSIDIQVHHRDKSEKEDHRIWSWSDERIKKELSKCDFLCKKCHIELHSNELKKPITHGTRSGYAYKGCRCSLCKEAQNEYNKKWIKKKKICD